MNLSKKIIILSTGALLLASLQAIQPSPPSITLEQRISEANAYQENKQENVQEIIETPCGPYKKSGNPFVPPPCYEEAYGILGRLYEAAAPQALQVLDAELDVPFLGRISQGFKVNEEQLISNIDGTIVKVSHYGIDIANRTGDQRIKAAQDGIVVWKQLSNKGYGNHVVIDHGGFLTLYAHMSEVYARLNQFFEKGEVLGVIGSTGDSTGPHLHFEIIVPYKLPEGTLGGKEFEILNFFFNSDTTYPYFDEGYKVHNLRLNPSFFLPMQKIDDYVQAETEKYHLKEEISVIINNYEPKAMEELRKQRVNGSFVIPINGRLERQYEEGKYEHMDFSAEHDKQEVYAATSGTIEQVLTWDGMNKKMTIKHGENLFTEYLPLSETFFQEGDSVSEGNVIGRTGIPNDPLFGSQPVLYFTAFLRFMSPQSLLSQEEIDKLSSYITLSGNNGIMHYLYPELRIDPLPLIKER